LGLPQLPNQVAVPWAMGPLQGSRHLGDASDLQTCLCRMAGLTPEHKRIVIYSNRMLFPILAWCCPPISARGSCSGRDRTTWGTRWHPTREGDGRFRPMCHPPPSLIPTWRAIDAKGRAKQGLAKWQSISLALPSAKVAASGFPVLPSE
jgi:hypothetical protein